MAETPSDLNRFWKLSPLERTKFPAAKENLNNQSRCDKNIAKGSAANFLRDSVRIFRGDAFWKLNAVLYNRLGWKWIKPHYLCARSITDFKHSPCTPNLAATPQSQLLHISTTVILTDMRASKLLRLLSTCKVGWLGFNGTFSTNRLTIMPQRKIKVCWRYLFRIGS